MRVHIVKIGEPLPGEGLRARRMTVFARALIAAGHEVTWWTSDWNHQLKRRRSAEAGAAAGQEGIAVRMLSAPGYARNVSPMRLLHHLVFALRLRRELPKTERPDLVWACFPTVPSALALDGWSRRHRIPVIYDVRDLSPDVIIQSLPSRLRRAAKLAAAPVYRALGRAFSRAAGLTGVSPAYLEWARTLAALHGKPPASRVLPLGYELEDHPAARRGAVLQELTAGGLAADQRLRVVYAGSFGRSYDLATVFDAAALCARRGIPAQFVFAGGGDQVAEVQRRVSALPNAVYLGWLDAERLGILLSSCHIGLMPYTTSATQGLPNKLFEYLGNGLCILNTLPTEAREFIAAHDIGDTYAPGDAEQLATAVARLEAERGALDRQRENARAVFERGLDSAGLSRQMAEFAIEVRAAHA